MAQATAKSYEGRLVFDRNGDKIGKIDSLYRDQDHEGNQIDWALVNTGMFGTKGSFVLLRGATMQQDDIRVAFDKDTVKDAPRVEAGDELASDDERRPVAISIPWIGGDLGVGRHFRRRLRGLGHTNTIIRAWAHGFAQRSTGAGTGGSRGLFLEDVAVGKLAESRTTVRDVRITRRLMHR